MRRLAPGEGAAAGPVTPALRALVAGSFAHRRKTLAGSVALAGGAPGRSRQEIRVALEQLGHPADARAERLSPADFRALAELLGDERRGPSAAGPCARKGQPRSVRGPDPRRGLKARARHRHAVDLAGRRGDAAGGSRRGPAGSPECPGIDGPAEQNLAALALRDVPRATPAGMLRPSCCGSSSGSPSPPDWVADPPTPPLSCAWRRRPRASREEPHCSPSPPASGPTCPPRSSPGAGWPAVPESACRSSRRRAPRSAS